MATVSVALPQDLSTIGPAGMLDYAKRAEALGFRGLWTLDSGVGAATSRVPFLDPFAALAAVATVTEQVELGIAVVVAARRNAAQLARDSASVDILAGGRLRLGLGVGSDAPSAERLGFAVSRRGERLTDTIGVLRALWADGPATFHGPFTDFEDVALATKPVHGSVPILLGASKPPALARTARLADGWIGAGSSPLAALPGQLAVLRQELEAAGRDSRTFPRAKRVYVAVEDTRERGVDRLTPVLDRMYDFDGLTARSGVVGPPADVAEALARLVDAGVTDLIMNPLYDMAEQLERLAEVRDLLGDRA